LPATTGHGGVRTGSVRGRRTREGDQKREKERGSSDHGEAECGGSMTGGGRNAQGGLYLAQPVKLP
jgi:hypothetical protein